MSRNTSELVNALRATAVRLSNGARYEWGHMGRCNCGHLVQTITEMSDYEIVQSTNFDLGEWSEHAKEYCEGTGHNVEDLFTSLYSVGFGYQDVMHLENLSDRRVLKRLGAEPRYLQRNKVEDVILYMNTLAGLLEEEQQSMLIPIKQPA